MIVRRRVVRRLIFCVWLALPIAAAAQIEVPFLNGRVNDLAQIIPPSEEQSIESRLERLERERGTQIVVLTIPSLEGEPIEDLGIRVADAWKIGREGVDDGVILIVASQDRRMRIEVGYGLEPTITDAHSRRILDNIMASRFRDGDFGGGVEAGVDALVTLAEGGELPAPAVRTANPARTGALPLLGFLAFFSFNLLRIRGAKGWIPYFFMMPFWFVVPWVTLGQPWSWILLLAWVIGFPILRALFSSIGGSIGRGGGGWTSGGGWSSSSGWSGGGGGFSGGGGSFGGGGSSGSW